MRKILYICLLSGWVSFAQAQTNTVVTSASQELEMPLSGFNLNTQTQPSWSNTSFLDSVAKLNMKILRYPGGTISQYWDWQNGRALPPSSWVQHGGGPYQNYSYIGTAPMQPQPLSSYKYALDQLNAAPLITLNVLSRTLADQLAMLHAADALGIPIVYIELGNEMYFEDTDFVTRFPTAGSYAREMNAWYDAIHQDFPNAAIAIIGAPENPLAPNGNPSPARVKFWNDSIYAHFNYLQAITFHEYFRHGNSANPPSASVTIANAFNRWNVFKSYSTDLMPPGVHAWFTEYNLNDNTQNYTVATTWLHGLFTAVIHALILADERITILTNHQVTGAAPFASLDSYTNFGDTTTNRLTAEGNAMRLLHEASAGNSLISALQFSVNPQQNQNGISFPSLIGWKYSNSGPEIDVVAINVSNTDFSLDVNSLFSGNYDYERIKAASNTQLNLTTDQLILEKGGHSGAISLPRYSMIRLFSPAIPLPVTLIDWYGVMKNDEIILYWATQTERNCQRFILERSFNGIDFESVATIECKNHHEGEGYSYSDRPGQRQGTVYYRLVQQDTDQTFQYFSIIAFEGKESRCKAYPNPVENYLSLDFCENAEFRLYNLQGQLCKSASNGTISLDLSGLPSGSYLLQSIEQYKISQQIIVKK